jgi:hypothetical protein
MSNTSGLEEELSFAKDLALTWGGVADGFPTRVTLHAAALILEGGFDQATNKERAELVQYFTQMLETIRLAHGPVEGSA